MTWTATISPTLSAPRLPASTAALTAALDLGAEQAELIAYRTSGDATGDYSSVVGYAGIRVV